MLVLDPYNHEENVHHGERIVNTRSRTIVATTTTTMTTTTTTSGSNGTSPNNSNGMNTVQTDSFTNKGHQLCYLIIQQLAMSRTAPPQLQDDILISMCSCVTEILTKHSLLFNGMIQRIDISHYQMFASVANELFEMNSSNSDYETGRLKITWARIVSLFAFSVRLAQEFKNDSQRVDNITRFLSTYMAKHVIPFVRANGGWEGLVEQFPPPTQSPSQFDVNSQLKKAILFSGLCVGIVATMYITSLLTK